MSRFLTPISRHLSRVCLALRLASPIPFPAALRSIGDPFRAALPVGLSVEKCRVVRHFSICRSDAFSRSSRQSTRDDASALRT
jgi:hypothetical protein